MKQLPHLFENNKKWVEKNISKDPAYFLEMSSYQKPKYLWIGCSDSRIPANDVVGLAPGELFVHRNIANLFVHSDLNCLSVLQYAIDVLGVEHIIVCGHYGCGGVLAAMQNQQFGLVDNWLTYIRDTYAKYKRELESIDDLTLRYNRLVELSVMTQVENISHTTVVQNGWAKGKKIAIHGWVYVLETGLLKDLDCMISRPSEVDKIYLRD